MFCRMTHNLETLDYYFPWLEYVKHLTRILVMHYFLRISWLTYVVLCTHFFTRWMQLLFLLFLCLMKSLLVICLWMQMLFFVIKSSVRWHSVPSKSWWTGGCLVANASWNKVLITLVLGMVFFSFLIFPYFLTGIL